MSTIGRIGYDPLPKSGIDLTQDLTVDDRRLSVCAKLIAIPNALGPVILELEEGRYMPLGTWYSRTTYRYTAGLRVALHLYFLGKPDNRLSWAAFDVEPDFTDGIVCCAVSKNKTEDGQDDGIKTLLLVSRGEKYVRVGIGEILDTQLFADVPARHIIIE